MDSQRDSSHGALPAVRLSADAREVDPGARAGDVSTSGSRSLHRYRRRLQRSRLLVQSTSTAQRGAGGDAASPRLLRTDISSRRAQVQELPATASAGETQVSVRGILYAGVQRQHAFCTLRRTAGALYRRQRHECHIGVHHLVVHHRPQATGMLSIA